MLYKRLHIAERKYLYLRGELIKTRDWRVETLLRFELIDTKHALTTLRTQIAALTAV